MHSSIIEKNLTLLSVLTVTVILTSFTSGCGETANDGRPARAKVTGTVTLNGSPIGGAHVVLHSTAEQGEDAVGKTDTDGAFALTTFTPGDGALPGEYKVTVSKVESKSAVTEEQAQQLLAEGRRIPPSQRTEVVPKEYTNPDKTPLSFKVQADTKNTLAIELKK